MLIGIVLQNKTDVMSCGLSTANVVSIIQKQKASKWRP